VFKSRKLHRASLGFAVSAPAVRFRKAAHLSLQAYRAAGRPGGTWRCKAAPDEHSSCLAPHLWKRRMFFRRAFCKHRDGSWSRMEPAILQTLAGRIQVTGGSRFYPGTKFMGLMWPSGWKLGWTTPSSNATRRAANPYRRVLLNNTTFPTLSSFAKSIIFKKTSVGGRAFPSAHRHRLSTWTLRISANVS
jgi:hypothetical protein